MWRIISGLLIIISTYLGAEYFWNIKVVEWKAQAQETIIAAQKAKLDPLAWAKVKQKSDELPAVYPFTRIKSAFSEVKNIFKEIKQLRAFKIQFEKNSIDVKTLWGLFDHLKKTKTALDNIYKNVDSIPNFLLNNNQIAQKTAILIKIEKAEEQLIDFLKFEKILQRFSDRNERLLVLLQNQNEPRSTGGFTGSIVLFDFKGDILSWKFSDIYALDRKVKAKDQLPAPFFFHKLSKTISLRDANFWPDFPTTARQYRTFFDSIDEKVPGTIIGINMNTIEEILKITGPVKFSQWGMELDTYNFDLGLQFLVESKITGRYEVKKPVELFANQILQKLNNPTYTIEGISQFNWKDFIKGKNILVHTQNRSLQKLMEKWHLSGDLQKKREADNFLYFDFVSIGANKSDKFVWTKIWHDSTISRDGKVRNFLKIKRTHALHNNEIQDLLGFNHLSENVRNLLTPDLLWKLGAGENRTIMRVYIPKEAEVISKNIPSGSLETYLDPDSDFRILQFPINVLPREKTAVKIEYQTQINRGSHNWRPYFLEVLGTPGREKTTFLETISTTDNGKFTAETKNIGRPDSLVDGDYRAVVEWTQKSNK